MAGNYIRSGVITPAPSRCHSADPAEPALPVDKVNKLNILSPATTPATPPTPPTNRRRDRLSLQKEREANRSKQFTNRLQRPGSGDKDTVRKGKRDFKQRQRNSLASEGSNGEVDDQKGLAKMAYAEQQKWITVQQKTFTKWCVGWLGGDRLG
jgi:hypothetical protein